MIERSVAGRTPSTDGFTLLDGCTPRSYRNRSVVGVVVVHGFTGCPASVMEVAERLDAEGFDVEVPRLAGHGTSVEDLLTTSWNDWRASVDLAIDAVTARCQQLVLVGQSMGATLCLAAARQLTLDARPPVGIVCINPATRSRGDDVMEMLADLIEDGIEVVPGEGSDIADPDSSDISYPGTPLRPLVSFLADGIAPIEDRYSELVAPLLLMTSRQDHVIDPADSVYLASQYGGPVEHVWLERSFHVATRDVERAEVNTMVADFTHQVSQIGPLT